MTTRLHCRVHNGWARGGGLAAALVLTCAACGQSRTESRPEIEGTLTLRAADNIDGPWDDCRGTDEYDDVGPGMTVTVLDPAGEIIGAGRTRSLVTGDQDGEGAIARAATIAEADGDAACTVSFSVQATDSDTFQIQVGTRGDQQVSKSELDDEDWYVEFELE